MISGTAQNKIALRPAATTSHNASRKIESALSVALLTVARFLPLPLSDHSVAHLPDICMFHRITGLPCPGCGMTRSFICMAHGRFVEAFHYHALGPIAFAIVCAWALFNVVRLAFPRMNTIQFSPDVRKIAAHAALVVVVLVWTARLAGFDALP